MAEYQKFAFLPCFCSCSFAHGTVLFSIFYLWRFSSDAVSLSEGLLLRVSAVPEPRAEAKSGPVERGADLDEAEKGVVLDATLPQMLAGLP